MWLNVNALELSEDDFSRSHCIVRGVLLTVLLLQVLSASE